MIRCPECGLEAADGAAFCDRCGQGLAQTAEPAPALAALKPGSVLKGGLEIVELTSQSSIENRYRAIRRIDSKSESFQIRERLGPAKGPSETVVAEMAPPAPQPSSPEEDPSGPRAKTRELKLPGRQGESGGTGVQEVAASSEPEVEREEPGQSAPVVLTDAVEENGSNGPTAATEPSTRGAEPPAQALDQPVSASMPQDDLGDVFGRVLALSLTLNHPAFYRALSGFAQDDRVYLVYPDETLTPLSRRSGGIKMREPEAVAVAIQISQAVSFMHRRALRLNDLCPDSVALDSQGRIRLTGLDYVSNDNEIQSEPIFNDGYTAPEIYRGRKVDKQADIFSVGALLYACLTGERIASESWREEPGLIRFYPPHVVTPAAEQAVRRALVFNPAERWRGIDAFKTELVRLNGIVSIRAAVLTDVGMMRELNEDSVLADEYSQLSLLDPAQSYLYVVADGMGGAAAGERASAIAVQTIRDYVQSRLSTDEAKNPGELLRAALEEANLRIIEYQQANPDSRGMGSTGVSALIAPPDTAIAWVGDSRAYALEAGRLRQITKDHSLVQRLVEIGQITREEARHHEHKNVITRSLGARQSGPAGAEALALRLRRGDRLLLCSDGLTAHVDDDEIAAILSRHTDPHEAALELIVAANAGGGSDNISVAVIYAG
jgi:PPM family protein phosphatase